MSGYFHNEGGIYKHSVRQEAPEVTLRPWRSYLVFRLVNFSWHINKQIIKD